MAFLLFLAFCVCSFPTRAQGTVTFGTNVSFDLKFHGGGADIITRQYTQAGPVFGGRLYAGLRLVAAGASGRYFATERQDVYELDANWGTFKAVPLSQISPAMAQQGWPTGLGYDWLRNQIILVSLGGEGYIHTYSAATDSWALLTSMENWDFDNIEYHRAEDAYYGAQNTYLSSAGDRVTLRISRANRDGTHGSSILIPELPFGVGFNDHEAEIVSIGDYLVLLLEPGRGFYDKGQAKESRIYMIKPATGEVMLTYRKAWSQWPPANTAPTVQIQSPENGATFNQGSTIRLRAAAGDAESYVTAVDFFANGQPIGTGTRTNSPFGPFELNWTPAAGNYALVARARDQEGATTESPAVNISVQKIASSTFELSFYPINGLSVVSGQVFTRRYSPQGPVDGGRLIPGMAVVRGADSNYFGTHWHQVYKIDPVTGGSQTMVVGSASGADALSWPMGVTYDSLRNRVLLVSLGGEGFLYGYSVLSNHWSTIASMQNHDFDSIVYHRGLDTTFAYGYDGDLYKLSANGEFLGSIDLPSIGLQVSPGAYQTEMTLVGNRIALLVEPAIPTPIQPGQESRIYMIDPATGGMELTYRKIWQTEPPNAPPTVEIINPTNGARFDVNATVNLRARASDSDGIVAGLVFYVNGTRVGLGSRTDGTNNVFQLPWKASVAGSYSIYATATDEDGAATDSAPAGFRVGEPESTENIVSIVASDPEATELSPLVAAIDPAHFTISRSGDRTRSITVFYSVHGTAINGEDYQAIPTTVTIPAGEASADITIIPLSDFSPGATELAETVGIRLEPSPLMNPLPSYQIDPLRREAAAMIYELQRPAGGALEVAVPGAGYTYQDAVRFLVAGYHPSLDFPAVDYFVDGVKVGSSNVEVDAIPHSGYVVHSFQWTGATAGTHVLRAKAVLANGQTLESSEISFSVFGVIARPPTVRITEPADGAVSVEGRTIPIRLVTEDVDGEVRRAAILLNGGTIYILEQPSIGSVVFNWTNPPAGRHTLTARVTDNSGLVGTSAPVRILVRDAETASFVKRDLPAMYAPGLPFVVSLQAAPPSGTRAYGVEDVPPPGWQVTGITFDGRFDPVTGKVKFGPFIDAQTRTLSYTVRPSTNANSRAVFGGNSSRDGELYPIGGDTFIDTFGPYHPADMDQNNSITLVELTGYAAAWKSGDSRTNVLLRADFVTRAGLIWKRGEAYRFDPKAPVPFCWIPLADPGPVMTAQSLAPATERIVEPWVTPGGSAEVQLMVWPPVGSTSFVIEENIPSGWGVTDISGDGVFNRGTGQIRWGIFLDNDPRSLKFTLIAPGWGSSVGELSGALSVDGQIQKIAGSSRVISRSEETDVRLATVRDDSGTLNIELKTAPGQTGVVEVSTDLVQWRELQSVYAPDGVVKVMDAEAGQGQLRFYRFRAD